jgi:hypothetical protein
MILQYNDILEKGDIIHDRNGETYTVTGGLVGLTLADYLGRYGRISLTVERPEITDTPPQFTGGQLEQIRNLSCWQKAYALLFEHNELANARIEYLESQLAPQHPCNIDNDPDDDEELAANAGWFRECIDIQEDYCICDRMAKAELIHVDPNCPIHGDAFRGNV